MARGARASARDEAVPARQEAVSRRGTSEVAFQSLDQAPWESALPVDATPVDPPAMSERFRRRMARLSAGSASREELLQIVRCTSDRCDRQADSWWNRLLQIYS
jgi:hypothetical protein